MKKLLNYYDTNNYSLQIVYIESMNLLIPLW